MGSSTEIKLTLGLDKYEFYCDSDILPQTMDISLGHCERFFGENVVAKLKTSSLAHAWLDTLGIHKYSFIAIQASATLELTEGDADYTKDNVFMMICHRSS